MRAVRLRAVDEALHVEDVPLPEPAGTEVRIRVAGCGVCHTDLHIVDGTQARVQLPVTLGHEVAGWIDAAGHEAEPLLADAKLERGQSVAVYGGWGCGRCPRCRGGSEQRCDASLAPGFQRDGGYAEALIVPHPRHLLPLGGLDPVRAAPLTDAGVTPYRAVRRAGPWLNPAARVLVVGAGALGRFAIQYLRLLPEGGHELRIAATDLDPARLEEAMGLGADEGLSASEMARAAVALGGAPNVILDFVGSETTLAEGMAALAPGGLFVLVGEAGGEHPFSFQHAPIESWLTTVAWGSPEDLRDVLGLAQDGRLRWEVQKVPLADAATAHARLRAGDARARLVLTP